ncbi:MAG: LamG domain-containing protein [Planctomycetota bacterium]|jgi:hypothetical protein|nr:LamG domain-containing protein [Planctomycetota bacterium]
MPLILLTIAATVVSAADAVPQVAAFDMATATGETVADAGGGGLEARLVKGATVASDAERGKVLQLDGSGARLELPASLQTDRLVERLSVSLWVKPEARPQGDSIKLVTKRKAWWASTPFALAVNKQGHLFLNCYDGKWHTLTSKAKLTLDRWQHVAATIDVAGECAIYLDGKLVAKGMTKLKRLTANSDPVVFGYEQAGKGPGTRTNPYAGLMNGMHIYASALTAEQVAADMAGTLAVRAAVADDLSPRGLQAANIPAEVAVSPAADAPLRCELVFDDPIAATGMWYENEGVKLDSVNATSALVLQGGSAPGVAHARSLRMSVTDPRFKQGAMPTVDIEVEFRHPHWSSVELYGDTAEGCRRLGVTWGGSKKFKTLKVEIDDAFFGERDFGNPDTKLRSDGYDLRINSFSGDSHIRAVRVIGYDRSNNVNWGRLLRHRGTEADSPVFLFADTGSHELRLNFHNAALIDFTGTWTALIEDRNGTELATDSGALAVTADGDGQTAVSLRVDGWKRDVYRMVWSLNGPDGSQVMQRTISFGLAESAAPLAKAKPGEFQFGLDTSLSKTYTDPRLLAWCDLMGVDIVRSGAKLTDMDKAMPIYREHKLAIMPHAEPHWMDDAGKRRANAIKVAEQAAAVAAKYPEIVYWELGNEPDLTGFYAGPIQTYLDDATLVAKAIKKANPNTIVMNGGLAFGGASEGPARSRELIKNIDLSIFDAIAYHGHGPGVGAERHSLERSRRAAKEFGKEPRYFIETESGVAASDKPEQEDMQAATVIQKIVYVQSEGAPTFMWFRLSFEHKLAYGNTYNRQQPRPAVLAYRHLVERLRHHRFVAKVDLGNSDCEAYAFAENDGDGRVLVYWANRKGTVHTASLALADKAAALSDPEHRDLYGNRSEHRLLGRTTQVTVGATPGFLVYRSAEDTLPALTPAPVELTDAAVLVAGNEQDVRVTVRNPFDQAFTGSVQVVVSAPVSVTPAVATLPVSLEAGATTTLIQRVSVATGEAGIAWPQAWQVFVGLYRDQIDLAALQQIPDSLPGADGPVAGRSVALLDHGIDLAKGAGEYRERRAAVIMAEVNAPRAGTYMVGASADWWMAWYVNGQPVYDTLKTGNSSGFAITDHVFEIELKQGRNLVSALVLSGSQGWRVLTGGPDAVRRIREAGSEQIQLELRDAAGATLATATSALELVRPLLAPAGAGSAAERVAGVDPIASLGEANIHNEWTKAPDQSKWWHNEADLSAKLWLFDAGTTVQAVLRVQDTEAKPGDGAAIAIADASGAIKGRWPATDSTRDEAAGVTWYQIAVPSAELGTDSLRVTVSVDDDDQGYHKQTLRWHADAGGEEAEPVRWHHVGRR